jgi:hypothetical protein
MAASITTPAGADFGNSWPLTVLFEQAHAGTVESDDADLAEFDESEIDECFALLQSGSDVAVCRQ